MGQPTQAPATVFRDEEPWVCLATGEDLRTWTREDEIAYNQRNRQGQKLAFFVNAFDFIASLGVIGDYYEFGSHRARTFRMALTEARRHSLDTMRFFAFDSFEGLPELETETGVKEYFRGALTTSEEEFHRLVREHGIYADRVQTMKGFYRDSLKTEGAGALKVGASKAAIVNVDCDLYESAVDVFAYLEDVLQPGTLIYIDDYFAGLKGSPVTGPARAFHEFEKVSRLKYAPHMQAGWWGKSFIAFTENP